MIKKRLVWNWHEGFCTLKLMKYFQTPDGMEDVYWHWEIHGPRFLDPFSPVVIDFEFGLSNWMWA